MKLVFSHLVVTFGALTTGINWPTVVLMFDANPAQVLIGMACWIIVLALIAGGLARLGYQDALETGQRLGTAVRVQRSL